METQKVKTEEKNFDAVGFVRAVREKMSADMWGMSTEEIKAYLAERSEWARENKEDDKKS